MNVISKSNKRRQAPFMEYKPFPNVIHNTMLTVRYCKETYHLLKKESETNGSSVVRKRCRALMAKMSEPGLGSRRIAEATGCSRNFVSTLINTYNKEGIGAVLCIRPRSGRPGRMNAHLEEIVRKLEERPVRSRAEAAHTIREITGITVGLTWTGVILRRCGFRFRKLQPMPGKADPEKQKELVADLQNIMEDAAQGRRRLLFMDAVHFTLEAFTCNVWCRNPLFLKTGAGRNRFNLLGCIDPFTLELISVHSMMYVDAEQTKAFLEKVREASGDLPVSVVLDNARYQHCRAVMDKAAELDIELVFLPPYSPNLNIIERLWKYARKHVLAGRYFDTPAKFHEALRHFFDEDFVNHKEALSSLLTLKFQSFENAQILCA